MKKTLELEFKVDGGDLVCDVSEGKSGLRGSERMIAVSWGIKARVYKTAEGKQHVKAFLFDRDRFDKERAARWIEKNAEAIGKTVDAVQEGMPSGSFDDITLRLHQEIAKSGYFPTDEYGNVMAYICHVFPDYCVVEYAGKYYKFTYSDEDGRLELSGPVEVDMQFVVREARAFAQRARMLLRPNCEIAEETPNARIAEADQAKPERREIIAVLIEYGANYTKNRYYPKQTIQEAAYLFAGLKMYMNHPTPSEERERPERSVDDWLATIEESWYEDGKAMGRIKVHDDVLWAKLKDPVFRENVGLSINASGRMSDKEIDGKMMKVVEKIFEPTSVDFVTEPGARGRVQELLESQRKEEEDRNMLETVTIEKLMEGRPDLVKKIEDKVREGMKGETEAKIQEAVDKAVKEALAKAKEDREKADAASKFAAKAASLVEAAKLPKAAAARVLESLKGVEYKDEADVEAKVKEAVKRTKDYLAEAAGIKIGMGEGRGDEGAGRITEGLEKRLGLKSEKK